MSGTHSFTEREPKRTFIWLLGNCDGSVAKYRTDMETYRELKRTDSISGLWVYEQPGEAGVFPLMSEWNAIHGSEGCGTPCAKCDAAGYDPLTGKSKGVGR